MATTLSLTTKVSILMRRCALVSLVAALLAAPADAEAQGRRARLSEDLAEQLRSGLQADTTVIVNGTQARVDRIAARHGLVVRKRLQTGAVLEVPAGQLAAVAEDAEVGQLASNHRMRAQMGVMVASTGADQVHAGIEGVGPITGKGIGVVVIDSGIADVPELRGRVLARVDFTGRRAVVEQGRGRDAHGHGTHVAGIIAAAGTNRYDDTTGMAPGAHLVSLKVLDADGSGYAGDVIEAIDWAIANKDRYQLRVINISIGGPVLQACSEDPLCQAVERAYRAGFVVVASAGNLGKTADGTEVFGGITVPGNSPFAITAGAVNNKGTAFRSDDEVTTFSSRGWTRFDHLIKPDLVAPGNKIKGLVSPGSTLEREHPELLIGRGKDARLELSGTSMAAASVSGAATLLLDRHESLAAAGVRLLLQATATLLQKTPILVGGAGSLNILAALIAGPHESFQVTTVMAGETIIASGLVFGSEALTGDNILWGE